VYKIQPGPYLFIMIMEAN